MLLGHALVGFDLDLEFVGQVLETVSFKAFVVFLPEDGKCFSCHHQTGTTTLLSCAPICASSFEHLADGAALAPSRFPVLEPELDVEFEVFNYFLPWLQALKVVSCHP